MNMPRHPMYWNSRPYTIDAEKTRGLVNRQTLHPEGGHRDRRGDARSHAVATGEAGGKGEAEGEEGPPGPGRRAGEEHRREEDVEPEENEQVLRPYGFLLLEEPRLYDFARYNECLMKR